MKDNEVYGDANAYDFGARLYDPRIGRWLAVDPLTAKYSFVSPYQFVNNCPLKLVDPDGKEWVNGYDAQVASLNKQKLDNPDSKKIQRQLNTALNNQAAVNEMIGKIKTNDISLYNYIENLQVSDIKTKEIVNVKVTVSLDYLSGRDGKESAKTSFSNFKKNGGQRYVEYKGLEGNYAPAPIDNNGDIGFDVVMFENSEWADITLANEAGDVMFRMEYPRASSESGSDNAKRDESGELDRGKYLKPGSAGKYSWDVQELYRDRKKSGEGKDPKNNPYPKKNE